MDTRTQTIKHPGARLLAPFDCLFPMLQVVMEGAHIELPKRRVPVARALAKGGFDSREAVLGVPEKSLPQAGLRLGVGVVGIKPDRRLRLRDRLPPFVLDETEDQPPCPVGRRIVGLDGQDGVDQFVRSRCVASVVCLDRMTR
jgi:hypothetical protein